jgi:hypothetical protein
MLGLGIFSGISIDPLLQLLLSASNMLSKIEERLLFSCKRTAMV